MIVISLLSSLLPVKSHWPRWWRCGQEPSPTPSALLSPLLHPGSVLWVERSTVLGWNEVTLCLLVTDGPIMMLCGLLPWTNVFKDTCLSVWSVFLKPSGQVKLSLADVSQCVSSWPTGSGSVERQWCVTSLHTVLILAVLPLQMEAVGQKLPESSFSYSQAQCILYDPTTSSSCVRATRASAVCLPSVSSPPRRPWCRAGLCAWTQLWPHQNLKETLIRHSIGNHLLV